MSDVPVIAEADKLDGFAHPRMVSEVLGHGVAEQTLLDAFEADRMHHAWLLIGPEGIGKATLAYRFARFLLAQGEEGIAQTDTLMVPEGHPVLAQVAALSHPNLLVMRRPWQADRKRLATSIPVSEVRRLKRFFGRTAGGAWRVVIIDRTDELNVAAANALLKSLEEPPPRCVFLMVCSAPGRLPATIRSRSQTLRLSPLGNEDLEAAIAGAFDSAEIERPDVKRIREMLPLAQGSVRWALQLLVGGGDEMHAGFVQTIRALPDMDYQSIHALADKLTAPGHEASYELFFSLAQETLARIVTHAATGKGAIQGEEPVAACLQTQAALAHWARLWETVRRDKAEADALNLDRKNLVLGTFFKLEETAREALQ